MRAIAAYNGELSLACTWSDPSRVLCVRAWIIYVLALYYPCCEERGLGMHARLYMESLRPADCFKQVVLYGISATGHGISSSGYNRNVAALNSK